MIDPVTSWFKILEVNDKSSETISLKVDQEWLNHYPQPTYVTFYQGCKFTDKEFQNLLTSYGVTPRSSTDQNPQSNGVVERVHQTVHNMLRTFDLQVWIFDPVEPWDGFLSLVAFGIRDTYHTTLQATPAELVFGRDMLFERTFIPDWEKIRERQQSQINAN